MWLSCLIACCAAGLLLLCQVQAAAPTFRLDPEYLIDTWETEDGLPENSATAMAQDPQGFLWIGTFNGLVRYDGVVFTPEKPPATAAVVNLHLERSGRLWVSSYQGLIVRENSQWRKVTEDDGWNGDPVRTFSERADGAVLMTTFRGRVVEAVQGRITALPSPPGENGQGYLGAVDESGRWCVVQNKFIGTWDGSVWTPLVPAEELAKLEREFVGVTQARAGGLWVMLGRDLRRYTAGKVVEHRKLQEGIPSVWSLYEDSASHLWLSSYNNGLRRLSPDGVLRHWDAASGVHHARRFVFEDREGNLWAGSSGGGLQRFRQRRFQSIGPEQGLTERNVTSVTASANTVWVGTYGGGLFRIEEGCAVSEPIKNVANIQSVLAARDGRLWAGTLNQGLWRRDLAGVWQRLPDADAAGGNGIALFEDSRGRVWVSGGQGVAMHEAGSVYRLPLLPSVFQFAEDATGDIWLSNVKGIYRVRGETYEPVLSGGQPLPGAAVLGRADDQMWIYTYDYTLLRWRGGAVERMPYTGPPVTGFIAEAGGTLWLHTARGILRWQQPEGGIPQEWLFDRNDGLPGLEAPAGRQPVCARDAAGRLWFATTKGAAMLDPARLQRNNIPPQVVFTSLEYHPAGGTKTTVVSLPASGESLHIPAGSHRLVAKFSAPSFCAPERMQFLMELKKPGARAGDTWGDSGLEREIEFFDLAPGDYTLRIRAANSDGLWNQESTVLSFSVQPHYWETLWFRTGGVLLLLAAGGGFVWWLQRFRHARMEERLALQQQRGELAHLGRVASMSELSGSLAHELNQPLAAILSNAQAAQRFLDQDPPDLVEVRDILTDIVAEDRRAGEVIRRMRGMLKKGETVMEPLALQTLAEEVIGMIRSDLVARNVSVTVDFAAGLPQVHGDRIQIQQVILNLLINACDAMTDTPAADRILRVTAQAEDGRVVLNVQDRGHGVGAGTEEKMFEPFYTTKSGGLGMGLAICRSIVTAHGGRLYAKNHPDGGAVLRMELPPYPANPHD